MKRMLTGSRARPLLVPLAPHPKRDEIKWFHLLSAFRHNLIEGFPRQCWERGVISVPFLGSKLVLVNSPEAIREMMVTKAEHFGRLSAGKRVLSPVVGSGLALSEGADWKRQRRMLAPAFGPRSTPVIATHVVRATNIAIARLKLRSDHDTVDLFGELGRLGLEIAAAALFSMSNKRHVSLIRDMMVMYGASIGRPRVADFILPYWVPTPAQVRRTRFRRRLMQLIDTVIRERAATFEPDSPRDLFDLLYHQMSGSAPDEMADHVSTMIAAGHETTAMTLFWALEILAQDSDLQKLVASEAEAISHDPVLAGESLSQLRLTEAVVRETLRLFPQAFMIGRQAITNTTVDGSAIPRGATVLVPIWMLHRNPHLWEQPDAFNPARFLGDNTPDRFGYLPFGAGPHVCIGAGLAITEATLVLAQFMRHFRISRVDDPPPTPMPSLSLRPDYSPRYALRLRDRT
jgi:cytochrome P450